MLATANDVFDVTGYSADDADVKKAQAIVEVFAGKPEALISNVNDLEWMRYAVCWQVAYMTSDPGSVFEQANIESLRQNDTSIDFGDKTYAIAPLAMKAVSRLSWNRSRSVSTGPVFDAAPPVRWEAD